MLVLKQVNGGLYYPKDTLVKDCFSLIKSKIEDRYPNTKIIAYCTDRERNNGDYYVDIDNGYADSPYFLVETKRVEVRSWLFNRLLRTDDVVVKTLAKIYPLDTITITVIADDAEVLKACQEVAKLDETKIKIEIGSPRSCPGSE